jgi:hypothetical protein
MRWALVILSLVCIGGAARADHDHDALLNELMAVHWKGLAEPPGRSDLQTDQELTMKLAPDDTFTGASKATAHIDGVAYSSTFEVDGKLLRAENAVEINYRWRGDGDSLPNGARWSGAHGKLTFYEHSQRSGKHLLKGMLDMTGGGQAMFELVD